MKTIQTWTCADCPLDEHGEHVGNQGTTAHEDGERHEHKTGHVVWYDTIDNKIVSQFNS